MPDIHVLDSHVADLIAAGEVVERPASVAKELMENALDAGATALTVEISHGGMAFLRVTDNGKGIPAHQLKTAFLRHATSKLSSEYDLEAIGTLGFRGEALAAISAVSRVEVMSCTPEAQLGASLSLEGGVPGPVEEAGCPVGTTMVVRDLFFNTPARLKFMKKDAAEGAAVSSIVHRIALSHPEVSVKFIRDGKQELLTPGDGQLQSAVYAVLGRELALGLRPVKSSGEDGMTVSGFVSMPACCRGSRNWQFFFVNGRQIKSRLMMAALEEAYKNQKMVGKFPACVLHLETKLNSVDVNVHPAKTEVKFGNERQVFSSVYHAVLSALDRDHSRPALEMHGHTPDKQPEPKKPAPIQEQIARQQARQTKLFSAVQTGGVRLNDSAWKRAAAPTVAAPVEKTPAPAAARNISTAPAPAVEKKPAPAPKVEEHKLIIPEAKPSDFVVKKDIPAENRPAPVETPVVSEPVEQVELPTPAKAVSTVSEETVEKIPAPASKAEEPLEVIEEEDEGIPWRLAGEVLHTYIIVEQGDSVFFIDKHAAHERMNFDRMKAQGYDPMAQTLLTPVVCRLPAEEVEALLANHDLLEEFGFDVDELGGQLAVRQAPFDVEVDDIEATLTEIARKLIVTGRADPAAARDDLLHTMACKAAIKGGWKTSDAELEKIAAAVMDGSVKYCPHGRPVAVELTRKELEKQFKRIV